MHGSNDKKLVYSNIWIPPLSVFQLVLLGTQWLHPVTCLEYWKPRFLFMLYRILHRCKLYELLVRLLINISVIQGLLLIAFACRNKRIEDEREIILICFFFFLIKQLNNKLIGDYSKFSIEKLRHLTFTANNNSNYLVKFYIVCISYCKSISYI